MGNDQAQNPPSAKTLVIVGAGPKAAAISAKAHVLANLGFPKVQSDDWDNVVRAIKTKLDEASFDTWFSRIRVDEIDKHRSVIRLLAPNRVVRDWVKANYGSLIDQSLAEGGLSNHSVEWMLPEDKPNLHVIVVERENVATNWRGEGGFTDGKCFLGTPPEKDVGFPYDSRYGSDVDRAMLEYSWQAFKIFLKRTTYGDWVDRGRRQPQHEEWGRYIKWVLDWAPPAALIKGWEVTSVEPVDSKLQIEIATTRRRKPLQADGIVFTGPGSPKSLPNMPAPADTENLVFDGRNYWKSIHDFRALTKGNIGLIGGGETAASIALSLLDLTFEHKGPVFNIDIINPHGTIFTRGESFRENRIFTNPNDWKKLDEPSRMEIIKRTDRGVFSVAAQTRLNEAERVNVLSGRVLRIERSGNKVTVKMHRGDHPAVVSRRYDKVIVALGFDAWYPLQLFPEHVRPACGTAAEQSALQRDIDEFLRVSFDSAFQKPLQKPNVHMPMVAGLAQGPGFPNLSCLGHLADWILARYIPPPK